MTDEITLTLMARDAMIRELASQLEAYRRLSDMQQQTIDGLMADLEKAEKPEKPVVSEMESTQPDPVAVPEVFEALEIATRHIDMDALKISHCNDAAFIQSAIAKATKADATHKSEPVAVPDGMVMVNRELVKALEDLASTVLIHSNATKNNFAWAELDYARAMLVAHEQGK